MQQLSVGLAVLLLVTYVLGLVFSLRTHKELFASAGHGGRTRTSTSGRSRSPSVMLAVVTVLVALVSEIFVESVQYAALSFGMTPAFVGFIVVALVGAAAEMTSAFAAARKNRLDLSVGIALGSSSQIALFVAPVLVLLSLFIAPTPMDLQFWPGAVIMVMFEHAHGGVRHQQRPLGLVRRRAAAGRLHDLRDDAVPAAARGGLSASRTGVPRPIRAESSDRLESTTRWPSGRPNRSSS